MARSVVEVEPEEGKGDTYGLHTRGRVAEVEQTPYHNRYSLDQGCYRVGDWRCDGEEHESDDVLSKVEDAVFDKLEDQEGGIHAGFAGAGGLCRCARRAGTR